jgi:glycosyltransferase involved in cell wall biosynthesis
VKAGLLAEARALVMCSDSESFGMSVAEALAAGTPVGCDPHVSVAIDRTRQTPGFWVPQHATAIADALRCLIADADRASAMGARGRALAAAEFSTQAVASRWSALYASLAQMSPRRAASCC